MTFNVWTFLFEVLNFLVLAFVLHRLLYRPLRDAIERRKAENERAKTDAEAARKAAETLKEQLAAKVAESDRERTEVLKKAAEQAEAEKSRRIADAEAAAKRIADLARSDAEQLRKDTLAGLEAEIGRLAVGLAERLLTQSCDVSLNAQLARHLVESLRAIGGEERERVRRDAGTDGAVIESAIPLDDGIRNDLIAAVGELLGRPCEMHFNLNSKLIAGALMRLGGDVWDASIASQLEAARGAVDEGNHV